MVAMSNFFINQVNPKFKEYNRPLFLATVVFIPTVVLTFLLFFLMLNDCSRTVVTATYIHALKRMIKDAPCIHSSTRVATICRRLDYYCETSHLACFVDTATYCDTPEGDYYRKVGTAAGPDPCPEYAPFTAEPETCPDVLPTLGAALGYAGFIELAVTICMVFALTQTGMLSGGTKGHMGKMIKEIMEEKDTGKEIADVIVSA